MTDHDPADGIAYVNGIYVPLAEATIPLTDRGFLRSDVTYDAIHVHGGRFFRLDDHLQRFQRNVEVLRMSLPCSTGELQAILAECVRRTGLRDAFVMVILSRGVAAKGTRDPRLSVNRLYAYAQPFVWIANAEQRAKGLRLAISDRRRIPPESLDPGIKNFHWLDMTMAVLDAYDQGQDTPVLHDGNGNVTEGPGFNIFMVKHGKLVTPDAGMLDGLTRRTVLDICTMNNIPCEARPLPIAELRTADEVFLTSTAGGIMPVTVIDDVPVGNGHPGLMTGRLHDIYWQLHDSGWKSVAVNYGR